NSTTSQKVYQVSWPDFDENHDYEFTNKISYAMPHLGIGYSGKQFDIYGSLGAGISSFTHSEALNYAEPGYSHRITDTFELKGTGIGVILGGKYNLPLPKSMSSGSFRAFLKLEAVILKVSTLTGTKIRAASNSTGNQSTQTTEGTLYQHNWNPYSTRGFAWWDVFETIPTDPAVTGAVEMGLNLSGIRVMIGISF
ncbi:MAG: hypothetical protein GY940_37815, partial [bacterium]|nr:hypothetical protein [bacterium]